MAIVQLSIQILEVKNIQKLFEHQEISRKLINLEKKTRKHRSTDPIIKINTHKYFVILERDINPMSGSNTSTSTRNKHFKNCAYCC